MYSEYTGICSQGPGVRKTDLSSIKAQFVPRGNFICQVISPQTKSPQNFQSVQRKITHWCTKNGIVE